MTTTKNLAELYDLPPLDWDAAAATLLEGQAGDAGGGPGRYTAWLATTNADGSPHVAESSIARPGREERAHYLLPQSFTYVIRSRHHSE